MSKQLYDLPRLDRSKEEKRYIKLRNGNNFVSSFRTSFFSASVSDTVLSASVKNINEKKNQ